MTSDEIRFDCRQRGDGGALVVLPHIDGAPLTDLIDSFEIAAGMQPAGDAYGGLIPEFYRFGPMQDHSLGRSTNAMGPKTPVLGCECGEWGCWPLMARITVTADLVVWDSFDQPHRTGRDYTAFGPFRFYRHQYDDALRRSQGEQAIRPAVMTGGSSPLPPATLRSRFTVRSKDHVHSGKQHPSRHECGARRASATWPRTHTPDRPLRV